MVLTSGRGSHGCHFGEAGIGAPDAYEDDQVSPEQHCRTAIGADEPDVALSRISKGW